jgi:predicted component of type VI protein secretion system
MDDPTSRPKHRMQIAEQLRHVKDVFDRAEVHQEVIALVQVGPDWQVEIG